MKKQFILDNVNSNSILRKIEFDLTLKFKNGKFKLNKEKKILSVVFKDGIDDIKESEFIKNVISDVQKDITIIEQEVENAVRRVLILKNLDCANCSAKIERIAKRTFNHEFIVVDFATNRFIIESSDQNLLDNLIEEVQIITNMVDSNIEVITPNDEKKDNTNKIVINKSRKLYFIIGVLMFLIGYITKTILHSIDFKHEWVILIIIYVTYISGYVLLAGDVLLGAFKNIQAGRIFDEKFLMSLATLTALGIGYYDEAIMVMLFYKIGELLQQYAVNYSRKSIASLIDIQPQSATIEVDGELTKVDPMEVVIGDTLFVKPGERVPLDGFVISGSASLDVSALTGESVLKEVSNKDEVLSGSICKDGNLMIQVTKIFKDSMVSKILDLVENASSQKSKSENFISKFAKYYTPIVVICAIIIVFALPLLSPKYQLGWTNGFKESIYTALIFLVVSCPCALVISIPLGFFGGIGSSSKQGILVKGSNYLEALNEVGVFVFDKTGTLTKGKFVVNEVISCSAYSTKEILEYSAYAESTSNHPIGISITKEYGLDKIDTKRIKYKYQPSLNGACAYVDDLEVTVGKKEYLIENNVNTDNLEDIKNKTVIYVAIDNKYVGYITLIDEIKEEVKITIEQLKELGIKKTIMLTGDNDEIANKVANEIGIDEVYANMNPVDKVKKFSKIKIKDGYNRKVAFVGDGINDAPVLSLADVGIAMGALGSDAAIEVADIVLMTDELSKLPLALKIAKKTRRIVMENIILALIVKIAVLAVAPLNIFNFLIYEAIFADVGVSLLAILNSLRILNLGKNK